MKCWRCGKEIGDSGKCAHCRAEQQRNAPITDAGRALRTIYDQYGCEVVLQNSHVLSNGIKDLLEDSEPIAEQIKKSIDSGVGSMYLNCFDRTELTKN